MLPNRLIKWCFSLLGVLSVHQCNRTCLDCRGGQQGKSLILTFKQTNQNSFLGCQDSLQSIALPDAATCITSVGSTGGGGGGGEGGMVGGGVEIGRELMTVAGRTGWPFTRGGRAKRVGRHALQATVANVK